MKRAIPRLFQAGLFSLIAFAMAGPLRAFVSVQPPTVEIIQPAGKKASGFFLIKNPMETPVDVEITPEPFPGAAGLANIPYQSWLTLPSKPFRLAPGEERKVKYKVRVPRGLSGETMVMVYFNVNVPEPSMGGVTVKRRHGAPIYVIAKNTEKIDASIEKLYARFSSTQTNSNVEFLIDVSNAGNVHLRPRGIVQIYKGTEMIEETGLQAGFPVFPSARHQYNSRSARSSWEPGDYQAKVVVYYGDEFGSNTQKEKTLGFKIGKDRKIDLLN